MLNKSTLSTIIFVLFITLLASCTGDEPEQETNGESSYQTVTVEQNQLQPFVTFEEDSIAQPQDIEVLPNGNLAALDYDLKSVLIFNENGERVVSFGRSGRGPGEFLQPINMEQTKGHLYIYDQAQFLWQKYTHNGTFVGSVKGVSGGLMMASDIDIISDGEYLIPSDGDRESLIHYNNTNSDQSKYFGLAMRDSIRGVNLEKNIDQSLKGEVPDLFKNMIYLDHSNDSYFAFLKSYGRLLKFNQSGDLLWDKQLSLPVIEKVKQEYIEANKNRQGGNLRMLLYAYDMDISEQAIYLLMNAPGDENQQLVALNTQGNIQTVYNLDYADGEFSQMAISKAGSTVDKIYLVNRSLGRIYSMPIPAE